MENLNPSARQALIGLLIMVALSILIVLFSVVGGSSDTSSNRQVILATPTQPPALLALNPTPTNTMPSNLWRVSAVLEPKRQNGYVYAVLEFENLATGQRKIGQCQQPSWTMPEMGHLYYFQNTYEDYWLFIPQEGIESNLQRFAPID